ncbi:28346_t:CDS:1, partial [Dentiscutata erythropus]
RFKNDVFSVGSGSTFAFGVLDSGLDYELSTNDAIELSRRSIIMLLIEMLLLVVLLEVHI